jgi:hypothetical protein
MRFGADYKFFLSYHAHTHTMATIVSEQVQKKGTWLGLGYGQVKKTYSVKTGI